VRLCATTVVRLEGALAHVGLRLLAAVARGVAKGLVPVGRLRKPALTCENICSGTGMRKRPTNRPSTNATRAFSEGSNQPGAGSDRAEATARRTLHSGRSARHDTRATRRERSRSAGPGLPVSSPGCYRSGSRQIPSEAGRGRVDRLLSAHPVRNPVDKSLPCPPCSPGKPYHEPAGEQVKPCMVMVRRRRRNGGTS
jgi:hypothetical protein